MARILLIDDDELVRSMVRVTLVRAGHTVIEARNGEEGLRLFAQGGADLVITDIAMPIKEGIAVLIELRKKHPALKMMAISGGGRQSATDNLLVAELMGAAKVLKKPFRIEILMAAVDELLQSGKGTPEAAV